MTLQDVLFTIVRFSLWGERFDEEVLTSFSEDDWRKLYILTNKQGLSAIFADGIGKLTQKSAVCMQLLLEEGIPAIIQAENRWEEQLKVTTKLANTLEKNGVRMLLVKGIGLSLCYPEPKHRESGDIDIYLFGDYEKGNRLAEKKHGAVVEKFSKKEDHIVIEDYQFDNHICFVWPANRKKAELDAYLKGLLENVELPRLADTSIFLPPANFNLLFLLSHSYSHFMREGMPLRQMTDMACFLKKFESELDWDESMEVLCRFQLKKFADSFFAFIAEYFGIEFSYKPVVTKQTLELMKNDIMDGEHTMVYPNSRLVSKIYIAKNAWQNRWRYDAFYEGGFLRFGIDVLWQNFKTAWFTWGYA